MKLNANGHYLFSIQESQHMEDINGFTPSEGIEWVDF